MRSNRTPASRRSLLDKSKTRWGRSRGLKSRLRQHYLSESKVALEQTGACSRAIVCFMLINPRHAQNDELLEHFQAKWEPVRRPEMRQLKEIERFRDSTQTESALAQSAGANVPTVTCGAGQVRSSWRVGRGRPNSWAQPSDSRHRGPIWRGTARVSSCIGCADDA
jgi:hypothetical protein